MKLDDPRRAATFVVRVLGGAGAGKTALVTALLDVPLASDEELARLQVLDGDEDLATSHDAVVFVVRGTPEPEAQTRIEAMDRERPKRVFVAVHASDLEPDGERVRDAWAEIVEPSRVYATAAPNGGCARGIEPLRAALLHDALETLDLPVLRTRLAKRPYATAIVAGAALVAAAEGLLPGAAAFVLATQVAAIASLYYLYTGKWLARTQVLALFPAFASDAAGGSLFLIAKSFLPPTGIADVFAAGIAASMTIAMLGAVAWVLDQGHSLEQRHQLKLAFRRMKARTRAERAAIARSRARWKDKDFWKDVVRRVVFE